MTEGAFNEEERFTAEDPVVAIGVERAVVGIKAVFENEADLHAVAEVFRTLKAKAVASLLAPFHLEGIDVIRAVNRLVHIGEAGIDNAVERNVSSKGGAGKSAEDCSCSKSLLKHFSEPF